MKTECEELRALLGDYLDGTLSPEEKQKFESSLSGCPEVQKEVEELESLQLELDTVSEKSVPFSADAQFYKMLEEQIGEQPKNAISFQWWQIAAAVALLVMSFFAGRMTLNESGQVSDNKEIARLQQDVSEMKELVMLSMIDNERASERIQAVKYITEVPAPNEKLLNSLVKTLNTDPSPNVRLAAARALQRFSNSQVVRSELVKSMELQKDPIVQIELINIMVQLEEKSAIRQLKKWSESADTENIVKKQAKVGIDILI